ncbi:MAG TPA: efflux RND transporter periplasmic adaptor subunit [Patescibacteria group bacterium]|nr:efflux RND transporter periplasmic adaptor subunit [Patescibacteria group bacterium]
MTTPRHSYPLATLCVAALLSACGGAKAPQTQGGGPPVTVRTTVLALGEWQDSVQALGTAKANESVTITAKVSETVRKVNFDSGDQVEAGAVLVDLTGQVQLAGLEEARAAFREAEQQLKRSEELSARKLIPGSLVDTQRANRDAARARMDQVRAQLSDRVITAPFDGVLGLRQVSPGSLVTPGTAIATLDDVSIVKLDFSVPETLIASLAPGQKVVATSAAFPDVPFEGVVHTIDSRVDPVTRSVMVRAEVPNPERKLRPGMLLTVDVRRAPRQALALPELALIQIGRNSFVFRVDGEGKVAQVPVKTAARERGRVEIIEGVSAGDRVVVEGTLKLRGGARVVEAGTAPAAAAKS